MFLLLILALPLVVAQATSTATTPAATTSGATSTTVGTVNGSNNASMTSSGPSAAQSSYQPVEDVSFKFAWRTLLDLPYNESRALGKINITFPGTNSYWVRLEPNVVKFSKKMSSLDPAHDEKSPPWGWLWLSGLVNSSTNASMFNFGVDVTADLGDTLNVRAWESNKSVFNWNLMRTRR